MNKYIKGSEWRRWDLHIHTPGTKKNDCFKGGTNDEKWNKYYEKVNEYIGDGSEPTKNIAVIGITDYLSIDNYKKVVNDKKLPDSIKLILPNVEMRIHPMGSNSPINIHFIFDPIITNELESRFFGKLSFSYGDIHYSATRDELTRLGKVLDNSMDDEMAYKMGISQFIPSLDSIKEVFKDRELRNSTIIGVSNSTTDGASGLVSLSSYCEEVGTPSQLTLFRQSIYKFVDFIFSSKPSDINYFMGNSRDNEANVINKCGSLKPCLHGSDAHELSKIFEPDMQKYCWIKANPTFNGLRQVIYEPKDRVRISPIKPELKVDYHVIERVEINDPEFINEPIFFNDKLTCIIGGKSTGKSILLNNLAMTIDNKQVMEKIEKSKNKTKILSSVKVFWADGTISQSGAQDDTHKIIYIPQTYLNRLSDNNEEETEIDKIIQEILLINDNAKKAYDDLQKFIREYKPYVDKKIYDLIQLHQEAMLLIEDKKELGSQEGLIKEIDKLKRQKDVLSKELSLEEDDIKRYDTALTDRRMANEKLQELEKDISIITSIKSVVESINVNNLLTNDTKELVSAAVEEIKAVANEAWIKSQVELISKLIKKRSNLSKVIHENTEIIENLSSKISSNEAISKLTHEIQIEESRLNKFIEIDKKWAVVSEAMKSEVVELVTTFDKYKQAHETYANYINNNPELPCDDLEFSVKTFFKADTFIESIKNIFDKRILKTKKDLIDCDDFNIEDLTREKITRLFVECLQNKLPLVKGYTLENAFRILLDNWYNISYSVKMDGDSIDLMSPGKKALVLLKLLINLADSKTPILLDQPEDDLDNRSIFEDLIPFIREKKIKRQIIIVTHNANVVVGGDAEAIIVANQKGANSPNKEFRFEYRSGSIEDDEPVIDEHGNIGTDTLSLKGIQQHICDILEGGERAFDLRKHKYRI